VDVHRQTCRIRIVDGVFCREESAWAYPLAVGSQKLMRGRLTFRAYQGKALFFRFDLF
jgi:hypothetical protein